jgi:hypothetical protein
MIMPSVALIGCVLTIWMAIKSHDGLVDEDYYKKGIEINQIIGQDNQASAMQLNAQVLISDDRRALRVILNQPLEHIPRLKLLHPTQAGQDQEILLTRMGPQLFTATLAQPFMPIAWEIQVTDRDNYWRLHGRWNKQHNHMTLTASLIRNWDGVKATP